MPEVLALIVVAAARVIAPLNEALPPVFVRAPPDKTPVPRREIASAVLKENPFKSKVAPLLTTAEAAVVPKGPLVPSPLAPSFNVPALIVVKPEYELSPASINVPLPAFVIAPVPLITPEMVN